MAEIQTYFLGISKKYFYKCVIYGKITISANKKNLKGAERFSSRKIGVFLWAAIS